MVIWLVEVPVILNVPFTVWVLREAKLKVLPATSHLKLLKVVLPEITDVTELKVILYALAALYRKKGYPRFVTLDDLRENAALLRSLPEPVDESIVKGLSSACQRGVFIRVGAEVNGQAASIYLLNAPADRDAALKITSGELKLSGIKVSGYPPVKPTPEPDLFQLYEQNMGMLTPVIADELRAAEKLYPQGWLQDAIKEAVNQNKRRWSYISAILERWAAEGKTDGTYQRNSKAGPDKYARQKYGNMVRR